LRRIVEHLPGREGDAVSRVVGLEPETA
jgi:hypothetical protein